MAYRDLGNGLRVESTKGLYAGDLGPILFLAAADRVLGVDSAWADCVAPWTSDRPEAMNTPGVGLVNGVGAHTYGTTVLYRLTGENRFLETARRFARSVDTETIRSVPDLDLNVGLTGYLVSLLALLREVDDTSVEERAVACGDRLLAAATNHDDGCYWTVDGESPARGLAHGNTGPALALAALGRRVDETRFRRAAVDALAFGRERFGPVGQRGEDLGRRALRLGWCRGASGIVIGRVRADAALDESVGVDHDRVVELLASGPESEDPLCHGTWSKVAALQYLADETASVAPERARSLALDVVDRREETGHYRLRFGSLDEIADPTLFTGLSGIGYTLLRVLPDSDLPPITALE